MQDTNTVQLLDSSIVQGFKNRFWETVRILDEGYERLISSIEVIKGTSIKSKRYVQMGVAYDFFVRNLQDYRAKLRDLETGFSKQIDREIDVDEDLDEVDRQLHKLVDQNERNYLLELLELLDAAARLETRWKSIPHSPKRQAYHLYSKAHDALRTFFREIETHLDTHYDVRRMTSDDCIGAYPPFETTRIAFREDNKTSDDIVVSRVISHAYSRKGRLFRKASVVVITKGANR